MKILIDDDISPYYGVTASRINKQLKSATGDITVEISSKGGSTFEGVRIYNLLKNYKKGKVTTVIMSHAISAASYIFMAGEERIVYDNSSYMAHPPSMGVFGTYKKHQDSADLLKRFFSAIVKEHSKISKRDELDIEAELIAEKYLFGQEIVDSGFATSLIESGKLESFNKEETITTLKEATSMCDSKNSQECLKNFKKEGYSEELTSMASLLDTMNKPNQNQHKEKEMDVTTSNGIKVFAATASSEDKIAIVTSLGGVDASTLKAKNDEVAKLTASHVEAISKRDTEDGKKLSNMQTSMKAVLTMIGSDSFSSLSVEAKMKALDEVTLSDDGSVDIDKVELSLHQAMASSSAPQSGGNTSEIDKLSEEAQKQAQEF